MGAERVLNFDFHAVAREGTIPTGDVAQADHEIVRTHERTFDLLARRKCYHGRGMGRCLTAAGIKHVGLELDRRVFGSDRGKIAGGWKTILAAAGSAEKGLSRGG